VSLAQLPDASLVACCRAGDQAAWAELVSRFARYVSAICVHGYRLSEEDAEDVFQEVFARTYEHLDRLRDDDAIRPWLAQLTRRLCVDKIRAGMRETLVGDELADIPDEGELATLDDALAVHEAMRGLSPECREILDRFFCRDESYRTIAETLDLPAGTVASRISRCLARLRELFTGEGRNSMDGASRET
jgi:RNA polymerase sigma-70 factor (ECF subfamily)